MDNFESHAKESIESYKKEGLRAIWVRVPLNMSTYISILASLGFTFHHAKDDYSMLTKWISEKENDQENKLPSYCVSTIGAGGVVLNEENNTILVIRERYVGLKEGEKEKALWKLPGGALDLGESIGETAVREVFEETGIQAEFVRLIGFRHLQNFRFHTDDLYFVCVLKPLSFNITIDDGEIAEAQWMPLDDYLNQLTLNSVQRSAAETLRRYLKTKRGLSMK
eukprot:CAMPEP_0117429798 /NCGR_PEP_ID=MMETSP0758-20121206/9327_1 /TAXON_ID=63605 /ORGANISM="Percolomonas cosmopolitus, Strain AE-1 (ATCC 50343)" /LENGTH=223 /DNA_ID=CAMNT_0005217157 /DNA_START=45 /DNA_END=713 /DNA_ORIENTATION=-